jgi:hypothetical protein
LGEKDCKTSGGNKVKYFKCKRCGKDISIRAGRTPNNTKYCSYECRRRVVNWRAWLKRKQSTLVKKTGLKWEIAKGNEYGPN